MTTMAMQHGAGARGEILARVKLEAAVLGLDPSCGPLPPGGEA
jgi:hypothetical protein